jgi:cytochrome c biogenesis protein CcmG/thiol:disulfide interchange protein DsbE
MRTGPSPEGHRIPHRLARPRPCGTLSRVSAGKLALAVGAIALAAVVGVGLQQASDDTAPPPKARTLTQADIERRLAGAPPALAALHRQANEILPGAKTALERRLDELEGHAAVVNIWAAWCGPCREELPVLQRVSLEMGKEVAFLGVDLKDDRESAARLLRRYPLTYPSYEDPDGKVYSAEGLQGVPSTLFYDARGRQTFVHQGPYFERQDLVDDIRRYALGAS